MTVTLLAGSETSIQNTDNNPRGIDANVYLLEPDAAPLTALMSMMGSRPADNPKVEWNENEAMPRITTLSASAAASATALGVAADIFRVGDVFRLPAYGFGGIVTATAAGAITATLLGTATVSAVTASEVYLVSNANAEGATLREIKFPQINSVYNYDQIIRTPVGLTETELGTLHYAGDERARLRREAGIEHARAIEQTAFFGFRSISSVTRTAGGLTSYITTNVTADTSGLTETEWQAFLQAGFRYGSQTKVAFCSPLALSAIEGFARAKQLESGQGTTYGIKMMTYVSGQGEVKLVKHPDWRDSTVFGSYVVLVDMDAVKDRPLRNVGQTRLLPDRQAPDYDGVKDEYRSETCIQVIHERRHAILTGITGYASS